MIIERTPLSMIHNLDNRYYHCFAFADAQFPEYEKASMDDMTAFLACQYGSDITAASDAAEAVSALWRWKKDRRIFLFDDALARSLVDAAGDMAWTEPLPADALMAFNYPCLYLQAPNIVAKGVDGFFLWLDKTAGILHVLLLMDDMESSLGWNIIVDPTLPLQECLPSFDQICDCICRKAYHGEPAARALIGGVLDSSMAVPNAVHMMLQKSLQLVMYIVSEGADILKEKEKAAVQEQGEAPAQDISLFFVGTMEGARLRRSFSEIKSERRMHMRKGHWHSYWTGPKNDPAKRKKVLKWIPPVIVSASAKKSAPDVKVTIIE